jgi:hypothetical protein
LQGDLAYLHFHRNEFQNAADIWESILPNYINDKWSVLEAGILENLIICYKSLGQRKHSCRVTSGILASPVCPGEKAVGWVKELEIATKEMEGALHCRDWRCLKIQVRELLNKVGDDEGIVINCTVSSELKAVCGGVFWLYLVFCG